MKPHACTFCIAILCFVTQIYAYDDCSQAKAARKALDDKFNTLILPLINKEPKWHYFGTPNHLESSVTIVPSQFQLKIDVEFYSPSELTVKTVDKFIVVEGKHAEKKDELGYISRQFVRRYPIPVDVYADEVIAELSTDGLLIVSAPKIIVARGEEDRDVPISITTRKRQEFEVKDEPEEDENQEIF